MTPRMTRITDWQSDEADIRRIRQAVFIDEQGIDPALEWDEHDATATHFLVHDAREGAIATARLLPDEHGRSRLGRIAVMKPNRGEGVATGLLRTIIGYARSQGLLELVLHAQQSATQLYAHLGFEVEGPVFTEAGIPHQKMSLEVRPAEVRRQGQLGEDEEIHHFTTPEAYIELLTRLVRQARQHLKLASPSGEPGIFDHPDVLEGISEVARSIPGHSVFILLQEDRALVQNGSPLITLARRLPSNITVRKPEGKLRLPDRNLVIVDYYGYALRSSSRDWNGQVNFNDPNMNQRLSDEFEQYWRQSRVSDETRGLSI